MPPNSRGDVVCDLCGFKAASEGYLKSHRGKRPCLKRQKPQADRTVVLEQSLRPRVNVSFPEPPALGKRPPPTLHRIPHGARATAAAAFASKIRDCIRSNTADSWTSLLRFPSIAFRQPEKDSQMKKSLTSIVKENVSRPAMNEVTVTGHSKKVRNKKMDGDSLLNRRVEQKLKDCDVSGAVRILSSDDVMTPPTLETLEALRSKHPAEQHNPSFPPKQSLMPMVGQFSAEEVLQAVTSFPNGSAGGPDGLRPQHLKDMLRGLRDPASIELACLMTLMLEGKVPDEICPVLYGASLTALLKKDGGIRPIAVGKPYVAWQVR
ncbi:hypothetical protein RvY_08442 [Ramazzottius varieornatus]|uniref:Uncharacterized protein n=1 Tax=Ramazzottius varieornatus TaxID=947166 RepID=A0A1D1VBG4_RAMVA|nr:hypothetical protein RvY_08442 [Ramazzottius varieornatus]